MASGAIVSAGEINSARFAGDVGFALTINQLTLIVTAIVALVLFDVAIDGAMREAMRAMIWDAPRQLIYAGVFLALLAAALRFTSEAMAALTANEIFTGAGDGRTLVRIIPRLAALIVGLSLGIPMLRLAIEDALYGGAVLGGAPDWSGVPACVIAAVAGSFYCAIGICAAVTGNGLVRRDASLRPRSWLDWAMDWALGLPLFVAALMLLAGATIPFLFSGFLTGLSGAPSTPYVPLIGTGIPILSSEFLANIVERYAPFQFGRLIADIVGFSLALLAIRFAGQSVLSFAAYKLFGAEGTALRPITIILSLAAVAYGVLIGGYIALQPVSDVVARYARWGDAAPALAQGWALIAALCFVLTGLAAALLGYGSLGRQSWSDFWFRRTLTGWLAASQQMQELNTSWRIFYLAMATIAMTLTAVFVSPIGVALAAEIGAIAVILCWGFAASFLFFPFAYAGIVSRVPFLLFLFFAALVFSALDLNDNHRIRLTASNSGELPVQRYGETVDLNAWLATRPDREQYAKAGIPYPVFVVATEGGGLRAAYTTAQMLAALQDLCPGFAQHVYAISGVSGGSAGAALFSGLVAAQGQPQKATACDFRRDDLPIPFVSNARAALSADLLSPLLSALLFPDALQRIAPVAVQAASRARTLEAAFERSWRSIGCEQDADCARNPLAGSLRSLIDGAKHPEIVPHLILNTTEVESGVAMPVSTLDLRPSAAPRATPNAANAGYAAAVETGAPQRCAEDRPGSNAVRQAQALGALRADYQAPARILQDELPQSADIALSTATMLSARFPFLTPAGRVDSLVCGARRYVDGGYFENSGVWAVNSLVQTLLAQQMAAAPEAAPLPEAAITVLVLRSTPPCESANPYADDCAAPENLAASAWTELFSPIRALLGTRSARARLARDDMSAAANLVSMLQERAANTVNAICLDARAQGIELASCAAQTRPTLRVLQLSFQNKRGTEIPLSWLLSAQARAPIDDAVARMLRTKQGDDGGKGDRNAIDGPVLQILCSLSPNDPRTPCP